MSAASAWCKLTNKVMVGPVQYTLWQLFVILVIQGVKRNMRLGLVFLRKLSEVFQVDLLGSLCRREGVKTLWNLEV